MVSVSESTDWSDTLSPVAMYKALRCPIIPLPEESGEYVMIEEKVLESQIG